MNMKTGMNVLMVGLYPPHIGGIASYVSNLKKALESLGVTVSVVTYGRGSGSHVYGTHVLTRLRGVSFVVTGVKKVLQVIKREDIDVIHAHYLVPPGLVGVFSKKISGLPVVVTCHGSDILVFSNGWKKWISKYVVRSSDCVAANSKATLEAVKELGGHAVYVPSGVDLNEFYPMDLEREAVTYVGSLHTVKGVDTFLRAMHGLNQKVWVIGDGPERKSLERLAEELHISCIFWGFRTDIPELMNRSKIVVLPSLHEGFGLTLLEAMACGTPVVGRNTGGIPELITGENGLLFETAEELHQKMEILLENNVLWNRLQENGLKTALKWSWEKTAHAYKKIYSDL